MLALGPSPRFYAYREPADLRKGFDGLCGLIRAEMKREPLSGDVYVFIHRRRTRINNLVENSIRPLALGRKNYLPAGSHKAAQCAAIMYSLLGTCELHGIDPHTYVHHRRRRIAATPVDQAWKPPCMSGMCCPMN